MVTIGVAGGSGSGKSTLVDQLRRIDIADQIAFLPHDAYYRNPTDMPDDVRVGENWDHPDALDNDLFVRHLDELKQGRAIEHPVYDFNIHRRTTATVRLEPRPVVVVEGILLFAIPAIRTRLDRKIFVDTPADLRILRRVLRDVRDRGRQVESVIEQYLRTVRPMHQQFVDPSRIYADLIVPWELQNPNAVEMLAAYIRTQLMTAL